MKIDISKLNEIKEELENLKSEEVVFVNEKNRMKYVIMPIKQYNLLESYRDLLYGDKDTDGSDVKIISSHAPSELSYDEYEAIKKQLLEMFDKTFRPKPEKLN